MTLESTAQVDCPACGRKVEVKVRSTINVPLNPELRTMLLDGKINVGRCSACGAAGPLGAPLLYHDMERGFCVQFYPPQAIDDSKFLRRFERSYPLTFKLPKDLPVDAGYLAHPHVVFDMDDLVCCIRFFEKLLPTKRGEGIGDKIADTVLRPWRTLGDKLGW
jgi:DNA-directed RNA polymerase subunit RPC12/RpoP